MTSISEETLIRLMRAVAQQAITRANQKARSTTTLKGVVVDVDEDLDTAYIRMDQEVMGSDPTQSDNYENPGVINVTRLGETWRDEEVRVTFDDAIANAMRTSVENSIILPFGTEEGKRIVLDGENGFIAMFDESDTLVGYLDALQWFVGSDDIGRVRMDPIGGLRVWDGNSQVRALLSAEEGLQVREGESGITGVAVRHDGIIVADPATGETITMTSGNRSTIPSPRWASSEQTNPSTSHSTPAITSFTSDDLDLRFVAASAASALGSQSYTPPGSYTEIADVNSSGSVSLQVGAAYRDPATSSPGVANFTSTSGSFTRRTGHSVVVRGGGSSSPAINDVEIGSVQSFSSATIPLTISLPSGVSDGDLVIVHVSLAGSAIPVGWTVPAGWVQLGVQAAGVGTSHILGSGVWYKRYSSGDPTSENLRINMTGPATTKVQATVVAVSNPYTYPAGLDIRRNNRSMPRGRVAQGVSTSATGLLNPTSFPMTLLTLDAPFEAKAGRDYSISFSAPIVEFNVVTASSILGIWIEIDTGSGFTGFIRGHRKETPGEHRAPFYVQRTYTPTQDEIVNARVRLTTAGTGYQVDFQGGPTEPLELIVRDEGGRF